MWASRRRPTWFQQNLPLLHTLLHNPGKRFAVTRKALVGLKAKVGPQTSTIKATILVMKTTQQWRALYNVTSTTHTQKKNIHITWDSTNPPFRGWMDWPSCWEMTPLFTLLLSRSIPWPQKDQWLNGVKRLGEEMISIIGWVHTCSYSM